MLGKELHAGLFLLEQPSLSTVFYASLAVKEEVSKLCRRWVKAPSWHTNAQRMSDAGVAALNAAKSKDLKALVTANGQLVEACDTKGECRRACEIFLTASEFVCDERPVLRPAG